MANQCFLGLDFGTESVRAIIVDRTGKELGSAVSPFGHGQIIPDSSAAKTLFQTPLPNNSALQHPSDWIESAAIAVTKATQKTAKSTIAGIGVDFTSCTMLPCTSVGTPLCLAHDDLGSDPHSWPKLWKHHGAAEQTDTINRVARERNETWLSRYGGIVGLEWFFPKVLEVIEKSPAVADRAEIWLEAGDWFVWQLVGGSADQLPRSTCLAGYKGLWSKKDGFPSREFLAACHPSLLEVAEKKMPGQMIAPGVSAGTLCTKLAKQFGLDEGIPVSAAIIDAHSGVPGAGVAENGTLVMVLGTSGCHMLLADVEQNIPGVAGIVEDGILPGHYGYETGQAAMGDAFDWVRRLTGHADFSTLDQLARDIPAGSDGIVALDWFNGCRTPLMDGSLTGAFIGLTLHHTQAHIYRATLEASAMCLRWIVDTLRNGGVEVNSFVATGGLPHHNPLFMEIVASALNAPVEIHGCEHGPALGAAILGACAANAFSSVKEAVEAMAGPSSSQSESKIIQPDPHAAACYNRVYKSYRTLAKTMSK